MATATPTATGRVIQITGPVVDIVFPAGELPANWPANPLVDWSVVVEHLDKLRSVALGQIGLLRGQAQAALDALGRAVEHARAGGMTSIGFLGFDGGRSRRLLPG
jgi:hypothetical protein